MRLVNFNYFYLINLIIFNYQFTIYNQFTISQYFLKSACSILNKY
jgi:hypothetical protein